MTDRPNPSYIEEMPTTSTVTLQNTPPLSPSLLNESSLTFLDRADPENLFIFPLEDEIHNPPQPQNSRSPIISKGPFIQPSDLQPSTSAQTVFSLEEVRPYPKVAARKLANRGRKLKKSTIVTDTPEKDAVRKDSYS